MKTNFICKPMKDELIPQDEFVIEKEITLERLQFEGFLNNPLDDYDFIEENINLMYEDKDGVLHCIFVTTTDHDFGILIESEGYSYARYAAYLAKKK